MEPVSIITMFTIFYTLFFLQILVNISHSSSVDTITPTQSIIDGQTLVSSGQSFELGFFSPGSSNNRRYLGIWYKTTPGVIVWVANRNDPLKDSNGTLVIDNNGHLAILNRTRSIIWSSSATTSITNISSPVAKLLESGNLVLRDKDGGNSEAYAWQSFDHPSDTLLEGMRTGRNFKTGLEWGLTSWKNEDNPSTGEYTYSLDVKGLPQIVGKHEVTGKIKYRIGPWNGHQFSGGPNLQAFSAIFKPLFIFNEDEVYSAFTSIENSVVTRVVVNPTGSWGRFMLYKNSNAWSTMYTMPVEVCDNYGYCGANGFCGVTTKTLCECLQGFHPWSEKEWQVLNYSSGCVRKTMLDCNGGSDGFVKLEGVKFPDFLEFWSNNSMSLEECAEMCLSNCSCTAYANSDIGKGSGCMIWFRDLIDMRELRVKVNEEFVYLRLPASEIESIGIVKRKRRLKIILTVSILTSSICIVILLILWWVLRKRRSKMVTVGQQCDKVNVELPFFDLATIVSATNNFSLECMIGSGGFGSVYKGTLITGQKVAVKRLSKNSGQGVKEFKNEIEVIAKLQHRNLVSLLGYCIEAQERMLIYEYMPNRSLDHFIFDNNRSIIMGWQKQFEIIMGIARGLLYLHRDSKLQIIHRDLKASNILLDDNFNPKISDFGLARIFADNEKEARTRRVVGTYGYMSPEYAIDGKFSVKSDVFSFGVLLLEIVSGKRNRRFYHPNHHHNLIGHAWLLWNEGRAIDLMDQCFGDSCKDAQVVRCIQVGLLCVQKFPHERPTMSSIVYMLENEGAALTRPKQPGFFIERSSNDDDSKSRTQSSYSLNTLTITMSNGR